MDQPSVIVKTSNPWYALILGISIIAAAGIAGGAFYYAKTLDYTLTVTGSAKKEVTADTVKWSSNFSRTILPQDLKGGYVQMDKDAATVKKFLLSKGVKESEITISPVSMQQVYSSNEQKDEAGKTIHEYTLSQDVMVQSSDVNGITTLANATQPLIDSGVFFSTNAPEYYVSNLPDLRIQLLSDAVGDARKRAEEIAKSDKRTVSSLQSASMGVVQVLQVNSTDVSDYGSYDTSSIKKDVMVTVKAAYTLQ